MATVTGFTSDRMLVIENETVTTGQVTNDHLILTQRGGTQIDAGNVRGAKGDTGPPGTPGTNGTNGTNGAPGVIQSVNDVSQASVYSPRIFANKTAIDGWTTAPVGAEAIDSAASIIWQKDSAGWFPASVLRTFPDTATRDSRWVNPPDGSFCQAPPGIPWQRDAGVWKATKTGYSRAYVSFGTPNVNWPVKFLCGRFAVSTDVNGYADIDMTNIWPEAGISPIPVNIITVHGTVQNSGAYCSQWNVAPTVSNIRWRFRDAAGGILASQGFNILMTVFFQNGAI
jgi:hypothetical protein